MRIATAARLCPGLLALACTDNKVSVYNTPPEVSIVRPLDGDTFAPGDIVEVEAVAVDSQDPSEALSVFWTSSLDGDLGEGAPDSNGELFLALSGLSAGLQALTLTVVDTDAESASEAVSFNVMQGGGEGPTVILIGPEDGSTWPSGEALTVVGTVTDADQAWETIEVTVTSSRDGNLWIGNPATTGTVSAEMPLLTVGSHLLTLTAQDQDGNVGSASATVEVLEDGRPVASIDSPLTGDSFGIDETISFQGTVSDTETEAELLHVVWTSDIDGLLANGVPDSSGFTAVGARLTEGVHTITLSAIDEEEKEGTSSIVVNVSDPLAVDNDGDSFSENDGDCDDRDPSTYPGAPELCDEVDNDCDLLVNEDFWDTYEDNDTDATAYDLGDVDGEILWTGDSLSLGGLTLHWADDEDWFQWDANDQLLLDNVDIQVRATGLPASGNFVLELWQNDGGWRLEDSDSGSASLTVAFTGDLLDDDEDDWAIRFYASTWPSRSCSTVYEIDISS